jgi:hypothetical protein
MKTSLVTIQVPLHPSTVALRSAIEAALGQYGQPLRWAITAIEDRTQTAHVEAVVTLEAAASALETPQHSA